MPQHPDQAHLLTGVFPGFTEIVAGLSFIATVKMMEQARQHTDQLAGEECHPVDLRRDERLEVGFIYTTRPTLFFVVPGSSRNVPAARSIWLNCNDMTSLRRQPYNHMIVTAAWRSSGRCFRTARNCYSSKNPCRGRTSLKR